jgi:hypothetical protein
MELKTGDIVRVRVYGGATVTRQVVEQMGQTVALATEEECKRAAREQRRPICIGFPLRDIKPKE